jgi:transcriptional regulator with XRE-family HTH domain
MHRPTITEIEAGRRRVDAGELKKFATTYDVSVSWLAGDEEGDTDGIDDRIRLAARELAKLKSEDLDKVVRLLRTMQKPKAKAKK